MKKIIYINLIIAISFVTSYAQSRQCIGVINGGGCRVLQTAVPFLRITPDARSGAMGDAGIAISPDANALHYNFAKQSFNTENAGASLTYTPWLRALGLQDIYLTHASGFKKLKNNQAIGASIKYFSLGKIDFTDENGSILNQGSPREFELAVGYSRELIKNRLSVSATGKYIYSNLASGQTVGGQLISSAQAGAVDFGLYYHKPIAGKGDLKNDLALGLTISNIGNKVAYSLSQDYLPQNLGIGSAYTMNLDKYNSITFALDINKLLVPTPDTIDANANRIKDWKEKSPIGAIFSSFSAPGGFSETIKEFTWSAGVEYWYDKQFAVRAGYFHESIDKGNRQYFTAGIGLKYNIFGINLSYLVPTTNQRNPLDNTLRFSLLFSFGSLTPELDEENN